MVPQTVLLAVLSVLPSARAERLVGRLGGSSYAARERVGGELVQLGRHALPYLRRGAQSADLEIALSCLLAADPDLQPHKSAAVGRTGFPIFTAEAARESLAGSKASPAMRQLLFAWLTGPRNIEWPGAEATRVQQAFKLLAAAE